jgi:hypothetical protein
MQAILKLPAGVISSSAWSMFHECTSYAQYHSQALWRDYYEPVQFLLDAWKNSSWMTNSAWLVPRSVIEAAGPWDERLSLHDDGEFFCRVILKASGIHFCKEAISYYRKGISNSLSSIRSERAVQSHLLVCQLYENHVLAHLNNAVTRQACANNYQYLVYEYYPYYPEIRAEASRRVAALGGSSVKPVSTPWFKLVDLLLGWKASKRLQLKVYGLGLNPASLKKMLYVRGSKAVE